MTQDNGHLFYWDGTQWFDLGPIQGPQGPPGDTGAPGAAGSSYVQRLIAPSAGLIYTVTHDLNTSHPLVQLWDAVTNGLIQGEVAAVDPNYIWVSFNVKPPNDVNVVIGAGVPPTAASAAGYYRHYQTAAATTWSVPHNLGFRPNVTVVDSAYDAIFPGNVHYPDDNNVTLTFSASVGGEAYLS
jgi:hypothetical protein